MYLSTDMKQKIKAAADRKGIAMSSLLKIIVYDYIYEHEKPKLDQQTQGPGFVQSYKLQPPEL
jgi:hypothetical protein